MDRIQPPPNYFGAPYPNNGTPYQPNQEPVNPYPNGTYPQPMQPNMYRDDMDKTVTEFYESFNKFVSSNLGRNVNVHCSFTDSTKWHDKEFIGILASAGDNYIIIFNKEENKHYLIIGVYIDYIEFSDQITMDGVTTK